MMVKKLNLKAVLLCARSDFLKWLLNGRMIILAALAVFIYICAVQPLTENSALMGKPLNTLEPYIAALNSGALMLFIPLGFLAVSSDFPEIDGSSMFSLIRTGRLNWFFGQLIDLLMMSAAYLFYIFSASTLPVFFSGFWGTEWSSVALDFGKEFPEQSQNFGALLLPKNLFNHISLADAAVQSTLFVFVYLILMGMVMMFFAILGKKSAGLIVCGSLIAVGSALCSVSSELMWAFPMANSVVWLHYTEFRREPFYPIWCSWIYFSVMIVLLTVLSLMFLKKFDCSVNISDGKQL